MLERLYVLYPLAQKGIFEAIEKETSDFSKDNLMHFLAQCSHESGGFRTLRENLNYSSERLLQVFPKYFTKELAEKYGRHPEMIANRVYASRMGNGDEKSGDGWKYRGRGLIQLTGKSNYEAFFKSNPGYSPEYLETSEGAAKSAVWFWKSRGLDKETDVVKITKKINGGVNGLNDRKSKYQDLCKFFKD